MIVDHCWEKVVNPANNYRRLIKNKRINMPSLKEMEEDLSFADWIEVTTEEPRCIYYFGPFFGVKEAQRSLPGYIEDLEQEGAKVVGFTIKMCQPRELTIGD